VTSSAAASRYARALFDVLLKESPQSIEKVQADLQDFANLLTGSAPIPATKKRAVAQELLHHASLPSPAAKLILLLADKDRLMLLPDVAKAYREQLMDHLKIVRGEVTSAMPLTDDTLRAIEQGLATATGRKVVLEAKVDASIIGGVVTRLGSTVYDGSVVTQLQKMKQALIDAGA
jgi:F-type H+-transporting ATPase subunit delta